MRIRVARPLGCEAFVSRYLQPTMYRNWNLTRVMGMPVPIDAFDGIKYDVKPGPAMAHPGGAQGRGAEKGR